MIELSLYLLPLLYHEYIYNSCHCIHTSAGRISKNSTSLSPPQKKETIQKENLLSRVTWHKQLCIYCHFLYFLFFYFCHGPCRRQAMVMAPRIRNVTDHITSRQEQTCLHWSIDWSKHACKTLWRFVTAKGIFMFRWATGQCHIGPCFWQNDWAYWWRDYLVYLNVK